MTIKIKSLLMGAAATSAMLGGMAFASSSVQALTLENGQTLSLDGGINVARNAGEQFTFSFSDVAVIRSGTSAPFVINDAVNVAPLSNLSIGATTGPFNAFLSGIALNDGTDVGFNADKVTLVDNRRGSADIFLNGSFFGESSGDKLGFGSISFQLTGTRRSTLLTLLAPNTSRDTSFSSQIEVVPTPAAVLPALFGMGAAAFRKKKRGGEDELVSVGLEEA